MEALGRVCACICMPSDIFGMVMVIEETSTINSMLYCHGNCITYKEGISKLILVHLMSQYINDVKRGFGS